MCMVCSLIIDFCQVKTFNLPLSTISMCSNKIFTYFIFNDFSRTYTNKSKMTVRCIQTHII